MMDLVSVRSSHLQRVGHDEGELVVIFKNGRRYRYFDVPSDVYERLVAAESVGAFFHKHVASGYRYKELLPDEDI